MSDNYTPKHAILDEDQVFFLNMVNDYRKEMGLLDLVAEAHLTEVAQNRIEHKVRAGQINHYGSQTVFSLLNLKGFTRNGEIISGGYATLLTTFRRYTESISHNQVIISNANYVGIGIVFQESKYYTLLIFSNHHLK